MPKDFGDMDRLKEGLFKLNKSDPSVSVFTNAKGELILSTCGWSASLDCSLASSYTPWFLFIYRICV